MPKVRRSVTISKEILEWINEQIRNKRFNNVSHALEYCAYKIMKQEQNKPKRTTH